MKRKYVAKLLHAYQILKKAFFKFSEDDGFIVSNGLSFKTIFSLIPISAIFLGIFTLIPSFKMYKEKMIELAIKYIIPGSTESVVQWLDTFVQKAGTISLIGFAGLIYISLDLFVSVDNQFNRAWSSVTKRPYVQKLLIYWSFLTVTPFILGGYFYYSGIIRSFLPISGLDEFYYSLLVYLLLNAFFFFLFYVIPNVKVHIGKALLISGAVSVAWIILKSIFAYYARVALTNWIIYGSVATVIFFLMWISFNWMIVIFGMEVLEVWQEKRYLEISTAKRNFLYDIGVIIYILKEFKKEFEGNGNGLTTGQVANRIRYTQEETEDLFTLLEYGSFIVVGNDIERHYHLKRDLSKIYLKEIERALWHKNRIYKTSLREVDAIYSKLETHYFGETKSKIAITDLIK